MQLKQDKNKSDKLSRIKAKLTGKSSDVTINTEFYLLAKELGCLSDLLGREFEVKYDDKGRIKKIRQLPMSIPSFITLMNEMEKDYKRQEKQMKKAKRGKKR